MTSNLQILDASRPDDLARWRWAIEAIPAGRRDMHWLPEYVAPYAGVAGGRALLAVWRPYGESSERIVVQPFVATLATLGKLASPYGYGGPVASDADGEGAEGYSDALDAWAVANGVNSEWCRLHPFLADHQQAVLRRARCYAGTEPAIPVNPEMEKQVAFLDLSIDVEAEMRKGHAHKVATARRSGVDVVESNDLAWFEAAYERTMKRLDAEPKWFLPAGFLWSLAAPFNVHGEGDRGWRRRSTLLVARRDGVPERGCIVLGAFDTAYYHYAAGDLVAPDVGAGNLLVVEAARWAQRAGYARFHLGGGTTRNLQDPLLTFKTGFSSRRTLTYVYQRRF